MMTVRQTGMLDVMNDHEFDAGTRHDVPRVPYEVAIMANPTASAGDGTGLVRGLGLQSCACLFFRLTRKARVGPGRSTLIS